MIQNKNSHQALTMVWENLNKHAASLKKVHLKTLFINNPRRAQEFSQEHEDMLIDYSKNFIVEETFELFKNLAGIRELTLHIEGLFAGAKINNTENRAALHTALRAVSNDALVIDNQNISAEIKLQLTRMKHFVEQVLTGQRRGFSDKPITDVVNIGLGGSNLGPSLICQALASYKTHLRTHFVSSVDGMDIQALTNILNPETTLFIIASKSFTTAETFINFDTFFDWFRKKTGVSPLTHHTIGVSANQDKMHQFGIAPENQFYIWDFVGGRYSVWSSISLAAALTIGFDNFCEFLLGGFSIDQHFIAKDYRENLPYILALLEVFYINCWGTQTRAILPYHSYLKKLPAYLQQLCMESLGKTNNRAGEMISQHTGNVIWGELGNDGQHSFYQLLHQGSILIPVDFIVPIHLEHDLPNNAHFNLVNALAQAQALMQGKSKEEIYAEMQNQGYSAKEIQSLASYRIYLGNKPSTTILIKKITPKILGQLLALYEHKVFVQSVMWDINPFDQWGVEFGKSLVEKYYCHERFYDNPADPAMERIYQYVKNNKIIK